jgi:hypothetical protein
MSDSPVKKGRGRPAKVIKKLILMRVTLQKSDLFNRQRLRIQRHLNQQRRRKRKPKRLQRRSLRKALNLRTAQHPKKVEDVPPKPIKQLQSGQLVEKVNFVNILNFFWLPIFKSIYLAHFRPRSSR